MNSHRIEKRSSSIARTCGKLYLSLIMIFIPATLLFSQVHPSSQEEDLTGKQKGDLLYLFIKHVDRKDIPKTNTPFLLRDLKKEKKRDDELANLELKLERLEAPLIKSNLEHLGISEKEIEEIETKRRELMKKYHEQYAKGQNPGPQIFQSEAIMSSEFPEHYALEEDPFITSILAERCKEVSISVCKRRVCVDQPIPLSVDDIWEQQDSDGNLDVLGPDTFSYDDVVYGYSSGSGWLGNYHRHSRTHRGQINISSSIELIESGTVREVGVTFEMLEGCTPGFPDSPCSNSACGFGEYKVGKPDSWGRGKTWTHFQITVKEPDSPLERQIPYYLVKSLYHDTGRIERNVACYAIHPPLTRFWWLHKEYPAGTIFIFEIGLEYWIKANGDGSEAAVYYNLRVNPFMNIEACSMEFPEEITIQVPD